MTVHGDSVVAARPAAADDSLLRPRSEYRTVDELFVLLREWVERDPDDVRMEFHDLLGYSTDVFFDFRTNVADEEQGFEISELRAVEGPE